MNEKLKQYEKSIKRVHKFAWTPKYSETIQAKVKSTLITYIAKKIIGELEWDLTYWDDNILEIKATTNQKWTEKILIEVVEFNSIKIESSSIEGLWDLGRNVKRVKLFIFAFQEYVATLDSSKIETLEKEAFNEKNLIDYIIPEKISPPKNTFRVKLPIMILCSMIFSAVIGFIFAELLFHKIYKFILFEIIIAIIIGFLFTRIVRVLYYSNYENLTKLILASIISTYLFSDIFLYYLILKTEDITYLHFLSIRYLGTNSIVFIVIYWIVKIAISYYIANYIFTLSFLSYLINRIPEDVIDFAIYHLEKGKEVELLKMELYKKGWTNEDDQDDVINAIGSIQTFQDLRRQ